ncbi:hypothetical protein P7K49_012525 [Saguinus oedipus]|uniref:Uncharacterized protein n=1 Tax=Saguinus oedipus TaxID=9490 RepID=A0ABQ9VW42_SAGOE|nr:hypothetical protein P7K49_012525 [Saguinus oedipus]
MHLCLLDPPQFMSQLQGRHSSPTGCPHRPPCPPRADSGNHFPPSSGAVFASQLQYLLSTAPFSLVSGVWCQDCGDACKTVTAKVHRD